jgi:hypothetical protein
LNHHQRINLKIVDETAFEKNFNGREIRRIDGGTNHIPSAI